MAEHLTEKEIADYKEAFSVFDKDGDGTVTVSELGTVMRTVGVTPTDEQLQQIIDEADRDGNGTVEFAEFLEMMSKTKNENQNTSEKEIYQAFCVFDKDDSGFISEEELRVVLTSLGRETVTPDDVEEFLCEADIDGDGRINYEEFYRIMMKNSTK